MSMMKNTLVILFLCIAFSEITACPSKQCTCSNGPNGIKVNCKRKNFDRIPAFTVTPDEYESLNLAYNNIQDVPDRAFHGLNLAQLDLSSNPIINISPQALIGLEDKLTHLVIEVNKNKVVQFPPGLVAGFTKLRSLVLKGFSIGTLSEGMFTNLTSLEKLELDACKIEEVEPNAFLGLEDSLVQLNLRGNKLQQVPRNSLKNLTKLEKLVLAQNKILNIGRNSFLNQKFLTELDLSQNSIQKMEIGAFSGIEQSLEFLGLHANLISQNNLQPLAKLVNLEQLNLGYNILSNSIPDNSFNDMRRLAYLNLQGNRLTLISPATFEGLHKELKVLLLSENMIVKLPDEVFHHFENLQQLYLDLMTLGGSFTQHTFHGLENSLEYLTMEGVKFTSADWDAIKYLKNLNTLNLCQNEIDSVPDLIFKNTPKLKSLLLSNNQIERLTQDGVHGLENSLQELTLENNKIKTISNCTFMDFKDLKLINLDGNPLHCDCQLVWLKKWMNNLDDMSRLDIFWQCETPLRHHDRDFRYVDESDLICEGQVTQEACKTYEVTSTPNPAHHPWVNISSVLSGSDYLLLRWTLLNGDGVTGVRIYYRVSKNDSYSYTFLIHPAIQEYKLSDLQPNTQYTVCLRLDMNNGVIGKLPDDNCVVLKTKEVFVPEDPPEDPNVLPSVIIGSALGGGLLLFLLAIFIGVTVCKYQRKKRAQSYSTRPQPPPPSVPNQIKVCDDPMPQIGCASKRFTRPKSVDSIASGEDVERCIGNINTLLISASNILNLTRDGNEGHYTDSGLSRDSATGTMSAMNSFHGSAIIKGSSRSLTDPLPSPPSTPTSPSARIVSGLSSHKISSSSQDLSKHVYDEIPVLI